MPSQTPIPFRKNNLETPLALWPAPHSVFPTGSPTIQHSSVIYSLQFAISPSEKSMMGDLRTSMDSAALSTMPTRTRSCFPDTEMTVTYVEPRTVLGIGII